MSTSASCGYIRNLAQPTVGEGVTIKVTDGDRTNPAPGGSKRNRTASRVSKRVDAANVREGYAEARASLARADATGQGYDPVYEGPREGWRLDGAAGRAGSSQWFG